MRETAAILGMPATRTNTHWSAAGQLTSSQRPSGDHASWRRPAPDSTRRGWELAEASFRTTTSWSAAPRISASVPPSGDSEAARIGAPGGAAIVATEWPLGHRGWHGSR